MSSEIEIEWIEYASTTVAQLEDLYARRGFAFPISGFVNAIERELMKNERDGE